MSAHGSPDLTCEPADGKTLISFVANVELISNLITHCLMQF
jgi:hypothetical protein